jgi:hypothetical protein
MAVQVPAVINPELILIRLSAGRCESRRSDASQACAAAAWQLLLHHKGDLKASSAHGQVKKASAGCDNGRVAEALAGNGCSHMSDTETGDGYGRVSETPAGDRPAVLEEASSGTECDSERDVQWPEDLRTALGRFSPARFESFCRAMETFGKGNDGGRTPLSHGMCQIHKM